MPYRAMLAMFIILSLSLGAAPAAPAATRAADAAAHARAKTKPNIILFVADDLGYADIGAQGLSKDVKTPNIDAIAAAGTRLTQGYVSCPVCSPTRAGLLTGRYQQRFGHELNPGADEAAGAGLPVDQVTLAQALKEAGYATGMVGKWHLGSEPEMHPMQRGFDAYFGFLGGAHSYVDVGRGSNRLQRGTTPLTEAPGYLTDAFGGEAVAFVDAHAGGDKPFFLYVAFNAVHVPMEAPAKYRERFKDVTDGKRQTMLAMLSAMDDAIGQVTAKLKEKQALDNTLIVFLSDNGGLPPANGSRNTPLRGAKGLVYEGGIRVPFIVQWTAGAIPAANVYDKPVIALDIFPTALAAAGAQPPKNVKLDGANLLPLLTGPSNATAHRTLYWRYGSRWAIRDGDFKLVQADEQGVQLFDLSQDTAEEKDLAAEQPDVVKRLQGKYDRWSSEMEPPRWQRSGRSKQRRKARAR